MHTASDLFEAKRVGRTGVILNVQGTVALEGDLSRIALLKSLGVRIVQEAPARSQKPREPARRL